jgi:hypothetical protein
MTIDQKVRYGVFAATAATALLASMGFHPIQLLINGDGLAID